MEIVEEKVIKTARAAQGVGASVLRKEDERHLQGKGNFIGNLQMHDLNEVAFLRSPVAHARITDIRIPKELDGCAFVRESMADAQDMVAEATIPSYQVAPMPPLAYRKVRHTGEAVAMTIARTRAEAEDLAEMIEVDYKELPVYVNNESALAATSDLIHEHWKDNTIITLKADINFAELANEADVVVHKTVDLSRQCILPMEGMAVLAYWDFQADQLVVYAGTQVPHLVQVGLALYLGMDQAQVRVISPDVGGGFGYKCVMQREELCVAWLAKTYKRPFRYMEDRREHLVVGANAREHHYEMTAYANRRGKVLALDAKIVINGGAYSNWPFAPAVVEAGQAIGNLPGPYSFRGYRCETVCVATNKPGLMAYRGVARTGVCFAIEQLMDAVAAEVSREPWEVRLENLVQPEQMPYTNVTNKHFDGGDYPRSLRRALEMIDVDAVRARQKRGEPDGRLIGLGVATYNEQSAHGTSVFANWGTPLVPGADQAFVRLTPDGGAEIRVGVHSHGQGMETTFAQIVNEILGIDISRVKMVHGDTGRTPYSTGTYASRSMVMSGGAVARASKALLPKLLHIGAHLLKADKDDVVFEDGRVRAGDASVSIAEIANAWYLHPQKLPQDVDPAGLEISLAYKPKVDTGSFSYASQAVVVAVDPKTGLVEILDYVMVEDCGRMINPMVVEGQAIGGVAQGIGTALYEEAPYDDQGQPMASTLADYVMPGAMEVPNIRFDHFETLSPNTEFGAKGVGEGGAIAPPATITSAINDALRGYDVLMAQTPVTPDRILDALAQAGQPVDSRGE